MHDLLAAVFIYDIRHQSEWTGVKIKKKKWKEMEDLDLFYFIQWNSAYILPQITLRGF